MTPSTSMADTPPCGNSPLTNKDLLDTYSNEATLVNSMKARGFPPHDINSMMKAFEEADA
eukprot:13187249-Ditylum_brightwellii.AAC.1